MHWSGADNCLRLRYSREEEKAHLSSLNLYACSDTQYFHIHIAKYAFQFKTPAKLLTVLLGRRRCHLLMGTVQKMQDLFPLTHEEQVGVAGPSALLSFSLMTATVL